MPSFTSRLQHAWNAFFGRDAPVYHNYGPTDAIQPSRHKLSRGADRSIVNSIYNRIAMDAAAISIRHTRNDENGRYLEDVGSLLNDCLKLSPNIDQTARAFRQDIVMTMFDEGVAAVVPTDTTLNPMTTGGYDIESMRVGVVKEWMPQHVKVEVYNEKSGRREEIVLPKKMVAIIENPLYAVMNEPNSTMQRLIRKLSLLDIVDEQSGSGKLDLIIQLPYVIKTEQRRRQAEIRRKDIEKQLAGSKYGIAYTDGTEHITQLNRSLENNLLQQVEFLTNQLYNQLGLTEEVFKGTADEKTMLNYQNRTLEPIVTAICEELTRKFLTKNARTRGETIQFFTEPFKLVPVVNIADIADKFTRNEILSPNEVRAILGIKPSGDPTSDELRNRNNKNDGTQQTIEGQQLPPGFEEGASEELAQSSTRDRAYTALIAHGDAPPETARLPSEFEVKEYEVRL